MGAWGPGLYSDDVAEDLRSTVAALCQLPMNGAEIVDTLVALHPASGDADDEDHTTFWLVVADQLHRKGIASPAPARALEIIDQGSDLTMKRSLGMTDADLRTRTKALTDLRARLVEPPPERPRRTLRSPQPLVAVAGDVLCYPTDHHGASRNPYDTKGVMAFTPAGWGACLVAATGHAFGYLAWYLVAPAGRTFTARPTLDQATEAIDGSASALGTLSRAHHTRMEMELLGSIEPPASPDLDELTLAAVTASDISISNHLGPPPRGLLVFP